MRTNNPTLPTKFLNQFGRARRLTVIPALFFILLIVPLCFSLHNVKVNKQLNDMVRVITWERKLKEHYILNLFNESCQIHSDVHGPINELIKDLETMLYGGKIIMPDTAQPILLPPSKNHSISQELRRKIGLYKQWRKLGTQLSQLKSGTTNYRTKLLEFNLILTQIELPHKEILKIYTATLNKQLNDILMMELLTVLLASGLGVILSVLQKKSNKALQESEDRFRQVFEASPLGRVMLDMDCKAIQVNQALSEILGYTTEELLQQTSQSITHPDDIEQERPLRTALLNQEIKSYQIQKRYRHKDGHFIWAFATTALINDNTGKPSYVIVQIQDISEQKNIMDALKTSESRYRNVVESATDGIIVADMNSKILSANNKAHEIFEYEPNELAGTPLSSIIPPIYREAHLAGMERLKATHHSILAGKLLEMEGLKKNGFIFPLELSLSTWENQAGEIFATAILRDVSERKMLQRERELLLQSNKSLEEFTLIASHDLQEPLRKIAFYTERFSNRESTSLKEESLLDIQRLLSSVHRMQNLITDLLAYSRISPQNTHFSVLNVNQILHELEVELSDEIRRNDATIEIASLPTIEGDESQIRSLFRHLIQNALKYRQAEVSPHIRIYGKLLNNPPNQPSDSMEKPIVEIQVQDNGIGFDEKYLDRIFKVFQKLHNQTEFPGTGVGLATCKKIVELHSGKITAGSRSGKGSTFIVTLPARQA